MIHAIEPREPANAIANSNEKQQRGQQKRKQSPPPEAATFELSHKPEGGDGGAQKEPSPDTLNPAQEEENDDDVGKSLDVTA